MKLFLLNSRENKESRKISFTILPFFYNFLHISKVLLKKKREKGWTVLGWFQPSGPVQRGKAPARAPALRVCAEALAFLNNWKRVSLLFNQVADHLQKDPRSSIPLQGGVPDDGSALRSPVVWGYCTMVNLHQSPWKTTLEHHFLPNFYGNIPESLHQSCSATYQLQIDYKD
jgi:hypothetical protein